MVAGMPPQLCAQPRGALPFLLLLNQAFFTRYGHWLSPITGWSLGLPSFSMPGLDSRRLHGGGPQFYQVSFLSFPLCESKQPPLQECALLCKVQSLGVHGHRQLVQEGLATPQEVQEETPPGHHTCREGGTGCTGLAPVSPQGPP